MKDIIIDTDNNVLSIKNGSFEFTKSDTQYSQRIIAERLQTVIGEDFQDLTKGLDLQNVMFNDKVSVSDLYSEILRNILTIDGVEEVQNIEFSQEQEQINVLISYVYNGEELEVEING